MIDPTGTEWLPYAEAARAVRVRKETLRVWAVRGKVTTYRTGRVVWVRMTDVRHAEAAWATRSRAQVGGSV